MKRDTLWRVAAKAEKGFGVAGLKALIKRR